MINQKFFNGNLAYATNLGETSPGRYLCEIQGVCISPTDINSVDYIVHWFKKPKVVGEWSCSLINEHYLEKAFFTEQELENILMQELLNG